MSGYDSTAVILTKYVHAFIADSGTTAPASIPDVTTASSYTPPTGYTLLGYTSSQNSISLTRNGGDVSFLGANQSASLKTVVAPVTYQLAIPALQMTNDVFKAYFGGGNISDADVFGIPKSPVAPDHAIYVVIVGSGGEKAAIHGSKAILSGSGSLDFGPGAITEVDLVASIVEDSDADDLASIFKAGLGTSAS